MKFENTRDKSNQLSFVEALFTGYAEDGGIYIPSSIPQVSIETLKQWAGLSYVDVVKKICRLFSKEDDIPKEDLNEIVDDAFRYFPLSEVIPVKQLSNGIKVAELFHGRTLAFKDLALSVTGKLLDYFLEKRHQHLILLIGTTGDTGSAAIESVRGSKWVDIIVMLPKDYCSWIQEHQMTTAIAENVHVYRVPVDEGEACHGIDELLKAIARDKTFSNTHNLGSINSINWFRIMVQMAHYYYIYLQLCPACDQEVEFVIPTGACGNLTAACTAYKTGLPLKLVCSVNNNDIVARILDSGDFSAKDVVLSLASAMCEKAPYNLERILHLFSDGNTELVKAIMEQFDKTGAVTIPEDCRQKIASVVRSSVTGDDDIKETMKRCYSETGYLLCPHTATAVNYCFKQRDSKAEVPSLQVCIATASPAKFPETVTAAGLIPQAHPIIDSLSNKPTRFTDLKRGENFEEILREKIIAISESKAL